MKNPVKPTVNFVRRHKVAIAIVGTAVICMYINRVALEQHNEFLMGNDLYDAFYGGLES